MEFIITVERFSQTDLEQLELVAPLIHKTLGTLVRHTPDSLEAYVETVETNAKIATTRTTAHCYFVSLDGNGRPRVRDLIRKICNHVLDYSIPRSKIDAAVKSYNINNSTGKILRLENEARGLFTHLANTGEGGEMLLCILAETFLRLPQIICKMPLKTSADMHYHGCDGIHADVDEDTGRLALYWGESKLHKGVTEAVYNCFQSIAPFLLDAGGSDATQERDLQLLRDGLDLNNKKLESALQRYLDPDDSMFKKLEYRGLCLVGFDSDAYPKEPNSKRADEIVAEIEKAFEHCKERIGKRVVKEKMDSFVIEVFCLPFPSVDDFRDAFLKELGLSNGSS